MYNDAAVANVAAVAVVNNAVVAVINGVESVNVAAVAVVNVAEAAPIYIAAVAFVNVAAIAVVNIAAVEVVNVTAVALIKVAELTDYLPKLVSSKKFKKMFSSGCQGMDFRETLTQKTHILNMYLILTSSSTPAWTPVSDVME